MTDVRELFRRLGAIETGTRELQLRRGRVTETVTTAELKPVITVRLTIPLDISAGCVSEAEAAVRSLNASGEQGIYRITVSEKGEILLHQMNSVWRIRETPTLNMCSELLGSYEAALAAAASCIENRVRSGKGESPS